MTIKTLTWETDLIAYLRSVSKTPFSWEKHNCFTFTNNAIEAMTGRNFMREFIGDCVDVCTDEKTAGEYLKSKGYKSHIHFFEKHFDARPSTLSMFRGDVAAARDLNGRAALGICQGDKLYMAGENGVSTISANFAKKAFAI